MTNAAQIDQVWLLLTQRSHDPIELPPYGITRVAVEIDKVLIPNGAGR